MMSQRMLALAAATIAALPVADAAAFQSTSLNYQCRLPLIGNQGTNLWIEIRDEPLVAGQASRPFQVTNSIRSTGLGSALAGIAGATSIKGTVTNSFTVYVPQGLTFPVKTVLEMSEAPLSNPLFVGAGGYLPPLTFEETGVEEMTLDRLDMNLTLLDADGEPIVLPRGSDVDSDGNPNTFDVTCTPEVGEGSKVGSFEVFDPSSTPTPSPTPFLPPPTAKPTTPATPAPSATPTGEFPKARLAYALEGSTTLNTLTKGSMPLTGGVDATLDVRTGDFVAALQLNDTQARLTALGFLPVTATVGFVPSGPTTGTLSDDQITTNSRMRIKVKSVKAFGAIPLVSGNDCQSKQLSDIALKSTGSFDPTGTGGTVAGTYKISDLNGCGPLGGLISPITAGGGNTITLKLTPKPTA